MDTSFDVIMAEVLYNLHRRHKYGGSHAAYEHVARGFKSHLRGKAMEAADELIHMGLVFKKPTNYGLQVSLNPERAQEIKSIIRRTLGVRVD
ncbi:MAG: hypothetical protein J4203_03450 [Candidatus Diapherotrites archaeon]|uniref:Uncharacterized protein n=2 Tax=Candidatus Iainarchaeum sp. TaxID=3101447 RepID=A0A8T4L6K5_9ARCH|nr:hypothetical protein [Candidatus Diapherotrites archaeon]